MREGAAVAAPTAAALCGSQSSIHLSGLTICIALMAHLGLHCGLGCSDPGHLTKLWACGAAVLELARIASFGFFSCNAGRLVELHSTTVVHVWEVGYRRTANDAWKICLKPGWAKGQRVLQGRNRVDKLVTHEERGVGAS